MTVLVVFAFLRLEKVCLASLKECEFEILERGDVSGYCEEAYFVVENETDCVRVWEKHTSIREPVGAHPVVDFSVNFVVCAFMGQCPTTGYSIDIERIWTDGERVFVEVVKCCPPVGFAVGQMITCPYVMALVEKTDMPFVFYVVNENYDGAELMFYEFPLVSLPIMVFVLLCLIVFVLEIKKVK